MSLSAPSSCCDKHSAMTSSGDRSGCRTASRTDCEDVSAVGRQRDVLGKGILTGGRGYKGRCRDDVATCPPCAQGPDPACRHQFIEPTLGRPAGKSRMPRQDGGDGGALRACLDAFKQFFRRGHVSAWRERRNRANVGGAIGQDVHRRSGAERRAATARRVSARDGANKKGQPRTVDLWVLVEAAGIEPASAGTRPLALHA